MLIFGCILFEGRFFCVIVFLKDRLWIYWVRICNCMVGCVEFGWVGVLLVVLLFIKFFFGGFMVFQYFCVKVLMLGLVGIFWFLCLIGQFFVDWGGCVVLYGIFVVDYFVIVVVVIVGWYIGYEIFFVFVICCVCYVYLFVYLVQYQIMQWWDQQ